MFKLFFLFLLQVIDQVASLEDRPNNNPIDVKLIAKRMQENPELAKIDPTFFQDKSKIELSDSESLISKNIFALLIDQLVEISNYPTLVAINISEKCRNDSQIYYDAKLLLLKWANQMFESTGRFPDRLFSSGNVHAKGHFDQCINVQAEWKSTSFTGKYCTVFLDSAPVLPEELAETVEEPNFCIPSSCSMEDFRYSVAQLIGSRTIETKTLEGNQNLTSIVALSDEKYCYTKEKINAPPQFNGADIVVISAFSILGTVVLLATLHEFWNIYNNHPVQTETDGFCIKSLHCFSMITNGRNLLSTKSVVVENFACLNGIRVLSTLWIIQLHSYYSFSMNFGSVPTYNEFTFHQDALTWLVHGILNSFVAVDTFFFFSGLLVACSLLRELDRNKGRFHIGLFYLRRYLRLTPVYAFILGFIATLLAYVGSGPYWQTMGDCITACKWNWWSNLLYINNYVFAYPKLCMEETWYLASEMQMFIFSPLFVYLLWKWWKVGVTFAMFTIVTSITGAIFVYIILDIPTMSFFTSNDEEFFFDYYMQSWARCPPYILGILLGWGLHCLKKSPVTIKRCVMIFGWIFAIVISLAVSYGNLNSDNVPSKVNDLFRVSYGTLHRLAWTVSLAWIIFACINGYGGIINQFLSWKLFIPLSRLTYVVYLTHYSYLKVWHSYNRKPYYYTAFTHTEHFFGTVLTVFLMAFGICLVIEVPFLNLEKLLLPNQARKAPESVDKENQSKIDELYSGSNL